MKISENIPLKDLTTMRLGGPARFVITAEFPEELREIYRFAKTGGELSDGKTTIKSDTPLKIFPLGGGANSIGRDEGYNGIILKNNFRGIEIIDQTSDEVMIRASAGEIWDDLVAWTTEHDYSGIEGMSKIPGSVGAAPVQNIGAYGQEISQAIDHVEAFDSKTNEIVTLSNNEMNFGYRRSIFNREEKDRYYITAIIITLWQDEYLKPPLYDSLQKYLDDNNISDYSPVSIRKAVSTIRAGKLPDPEKIASAGSFFKNIVLKTPEEIAEAESLGIHVFGDQINTGFLLEQCGLKGKIFHGFKVSETAALILMNVSGETHHNLELAKEEIKAAIAKKYPYQLEQEPVEIK
ncbi:MAG: UDP-N-acetylmuramate dehydrogenase [Candidatus Saccharibacteria bacterium]|nr:UDP-N-acetylmuramate dehydrogenase [Candidatus Saccharibacteria bacterium]